MELADVMQLAGSVIQKDKRTGQLVELTANELQRFYNLAFTDGLDAAVDRMMEPKK